MKLKQALMATTAAVLLTAGGAIAQESPSSRPDAQPLTPSANAPGSASGGLSAGAGAGVSSDSSSSSGVGVSGSAGSSSNSSANSSVSGGASLSSASLQEIKDDSTIVSALDMNVKKLKGMDIIGADGKKIGEIDKVLGDNANQPKAVTVDAGGFLGIGGHEVILGLDQLQKNSDKDFKVSMSKDQVEKLEKWEAKRDAGPARRDVATGTGGQPATSIPPR